jgi:hypothetical protein
MQAVQQEKGVSKAQERPDTGYMQQDYIRGHRRRRHNRPFGLGLSVMVRVINQLGQGLLI